MTDYDYIKRETAARKEYETYWESYLNGDLESFASTLDDNYEMIGTSENEVAHNKAEGIAFFKSQMQEMVGKAEMRNRKISAKPMNGMFLINENCDIFVLTGTGWSFYSKIRISTFLHETQLGWKVIQQHGSLPDMRVQEGETLAIEKIGRENIELRDAIKRATTELEYKNRELQIEAALERVRARAMAMQNSKELAELVAQVFKELTGLDFSLTRAYIYIIDPKSLSLEAWTFNNEIGGIPEPFHIQYLDLPYYKAMIKAWKAREKKLVYELSGEDKKGTDRVLFGETAYKNLPEAVKAGMTSVDKVYLSFSFNHFGAIQTGGLEPLSDEKLEIFDRFGNVFDLTYTRFNDLKQAEAQAREAQIEAALEKVRAKAMTMQSTKELKNVVYELRKQMGILGQKKLETCVIHLHDESEDLIQSWAGISPPDSQGEILETIANIPKKGLLIIEEALCAYSADRQEYVIINEGEKLKQWFSFLEKESPEGFLKLTDSVKGNIEQLRAYWSFADFAGGSLLMVTLDDPDEPTRRLLRRFSNVFGLAYRRFADLKYAEAQAREAQIEAALERVRSRTMAMQKSDELLDVASTVFQQVKALGIPQWDCGINIWNNGDKEFTFYPGTREGKILPSPCKIPLMEHPVFRRFHESRMRGDDLFIYEKEGDEQADHYQYMLSVPVLGDNLRNHETAGFQFPSYQIDHLANFAYGNLIFITYKHFPEMHDVFKRFTKVFEQTYTRFLDLQKAEAQAHEAQIESALERVRNKSLAMQRSDELEQVIASVFEMIVGLGIAMEGALLYVFNRESRNINLWIASVHFTNPVLIDLPFEEEMLDNEIISELWKSTENCQALNRVYTGVAKDDYFRYVQRHNSSIIPDQIDLPDWSFSFAAEKNSILGIDSWSGHTFTESDLTLLRRFAKVFEQAYTRFLDLQKAEAQARESQIQLSLERIRAKAMAMQHSDELSDFLTVVFEQFAVLNLNPVNCHLSFLDINNNRSTFRLTGKKGATIIATQEINLDAFHLWKQRVEDWKSGIFYDVDVLFTPSDRLPELGEIFKEILDKIPESDRPLPEDWPDGQYVVDGYCKYGYLGYSVNRPPSEEEKEITRRIASEFGNVYQRFLDLQKAEAQAREAKIEAALERIRARAMAMHHSRELRDGLTVLFNQFDILGIKPVQAQLSLFDVENNRFTHRSTGKGGRGNMGEQIINMDAMDIWKETIDKWKKSEPNSINSLYFPKETLPQLWALFDELSKQLPEAEIITQEDYPDGVYVTEGNFNYGYIGFSHYRKATAEEEEIVIRFATEFGRLYQRFLDLQKAEAQTRESQIQLSLERIRAKAMALQHSDELSDFLTVLFEQFNVLNLNPVFCHLSLFDIDNNRTTFRTTGKNGATLIATQEIDFNASPFWKQTIENWKAGHPNDVGVMYIPYESLNEVADIFKEIRSKLPEDVLPQPEDFPDGQYVVEGYCKYGYLGYSASRPPTEEEKEITRRIANEFGNVYQRFLDLQKAEAQAREAEIEVALEKVRSRSLAMHKSEELKEVVFSVFERLRELQIQTDSTNIVVYHDESKKAEFWTANEMNYATKFTLPMTERFYPIEGVKFRKEQKVFQRHLPFEEKNRFWEELFETPDFRKVPEARKNFLLEKTDCLTQLIAFGKFTGIMLNRYFNTPFSVWEFEITERFAKVFDQAYTRFLDLQKAEEQARESQIQLSLERIRAKAMAMQHSDELSDFLTVVFEQFTLLDLKPVFCHLSLLDLEINRMTYRMTGSKGARLFSSGQIDLDISSVWYDKIQELKSGRPREVDVMYFPNEIIPEISSHVKEMLGNPPENELPQLKDFPDGQYVVEGYCKYGYLGYSASSPPSEEEKEITRRIANEFGNVYQRFLDLQKAEAQAREAQIQLSLERVRARTMAMQKSDELAEVSYLLNKQVVELGIPTRGCAFNIYNEHDSTEWFSNLEGILPPYKTPREYIFQKYYEAGQRGETLLIEEFGGDRIKELYQYFASRNNSGNEAIDNHLAKAPDYQINHMAYFKYGYLLFITLAPAPEAHDVFKRFAKEFEQTYTRFLDLQRAEAQAREAQIEAALERVRSKAMAMHSSEDLAAAIRVFYLEMKGLSVTPRRLGVGLVSRKNRIAEISSMNTTEQGESVEVIGKLEMSGHPVLDGIYDHWLLQKEYHPVLRGNEIREYYSLIRPHIAYPDYPTDAVQFGYFFPFTEGSIYAWTEQELHEDELKIYRKFTTVLSLTYKRYKDLKDTEANALEAVRRASLDRVRAEIASMRTVDDLKRITPIIWHELTALGVPFVRCGVFIIDESAEHIQVHLSAPDGRSLGLLDLPFDSSELTVNSVNHWRQGIIFKTHWNKQEFLNFMQSMIKLGQISNQETYQGATQPPESLHLHFVPFKQGMLYVGNISPLEKEALELVKSLAESFSIAYARYEDFKNLEEAKNKIEITLSELKSTQAQLVQQEKLASLGQLTAGIAHEIKNPLNFVNNFSEVSMELIEEVLDSRHKTQDTRHKTEADEIEDEILEDIKANLKKIHEHGSRANGIVTSMLQHSRGGSGKKEPTDLNALIKEYVNLSFHGMRAGRKPIDVEVVLDLDEAAKEVSLVREDFTRVIINLCNNAFDAMREKVLKTQDARFKIQDGDFGNVRYVPKLRVTTTLENGQIKISFEDNGPGIPDEIKDKILQPFFTTKKGTEGTGLGLSITHDIVKAHGGSISISSDANGTIFTLTLPKNE